MPCSDLTEIMRLVLDRDEKLVDYRLRKRTCGAVIGGEALLLDIFKGRSSTDIIGLNTDDFCRLYPAPDQRLQFFYLKHFIALRALLRVYSGLDSGGAGDFCAIADIGADNGIITIDARIGVEAMTQEIKACGCCEGCGKKSSAGRPKKPGRKRVSKKNGKRPVD